MCRVFYHGAYKAPREFNWVIGVILLTLTLLLSFTGYLLPWDQLALWAVTVGTNMMGYTPVFGSSVKYVLLGSKEIGNDTLLRWYVLHVLATAVRDRDLHGRPLLARPQGRRDLGPAVGREERNGRRTRTPAPPVAGAPQGARSPRARRGGRGRGRRAKRTGRGDAARPVEAAAAPHPRRRRGGGGASPAEDVTTESGAKIPAHLLERAKRRAGRDRRRGEAGAAAAAGAAGGHRHRHDRPAGAERRPVRAVTPSGCSPSSSRARSSRRRPRPRTRCTSGRTCSSSSSRRS